jgi:putative transposase
MRAYSMDLRVRVLAACDDGMGTAEAAEAFSVSPAWVRRLKQRRREGGGIGPRAPARPGPALAPHADRLLALVRGHPGLTAGEYRDRLGVGVSALTVWRMLRRLGLTHKKSPPGGRAGPAGGRRGPGGLAGRGAAGPRPGPAGVPR